MRPTWPKGRTDTGSITQPNRAERLRVRVAIGEDPWSARTGKNLVRFRERIWRVTDVRPSPPSAAVYLIEAIPGERDSIVEWDPPSLRKG